MSIWPIPSLEAQEHSQRLADLVHHHIQKADGWISFAEFMQLALYAPGLGYYSAGSKKFGAGGDFVTAPEISPLFAQTIAHQVAQVLKMTQGNVLELGAGTGKLAADLLLTLAKLEVLPQQYFILDVSDHLREMQGEYLQKTLPPHLIQRVVWLDQLPLNFTGVILGNEVLDAIPVHIVHHAETALFERGLMIEHGVLAWQDRVLSESGLVDEVKKLNLPVGYVTELCPAVHGLIASLAQTLQHGLILMIDYGFCAHEYYHPQRNLGTLMCHYQHYAHSDPLINIGLQDITAHVDFTSVAHAGVNNGLALSGFCSQAQFLMNCGILEEMAQVSPHDMALYAPLAAAAQKLLSPAEMGDLFKVIGLTKHVEDALIGFSSGDKSHTL